MYMPKFELLSFASLPEQRKEIVLRAMLECLIVADWNYILEHPDLPALYDYAPKYILKVRPAGIDAWQDIPQTVALGSGDCFAEGTPLTLESGDEISIEHAKPGMRVRTRHDHVHTITNHGLMALHAPTYEVKSARGRRAIVTEKHRFWTKNRGWRRTLDLRAGDQLVELDGRGDEQTATLASIRPAGRRNVYDVTVEDKHEVFAGGLLLAQCKDFACWRIAELRQKGYDDVTPYIKVSYHEDPTGQQPMMTVYHIQVRCHNVIEDPSAILGMPSHVTYDQLRGDPAAMQGAAPPQMVVSQQPPMMMAAGDFGGYAPQYPPFVHAPFQPVNYAGMPVGLVDPWGRPLGHHPALYGMQG